MHRFGGHSLEWLRSYLGNQSFCIHHGTELVTGSAAEWRPARLCSRTFVVHPLCTSQLEDIAKKHQCNLWLYADDNQVGLYLLCPHADPNAAARAHLVTGEMRFRGLRLDGFKPSQFEPHSNRTDMVLYIARYRENS